MSLKYIVVTGAAGFIGMHLCRALLKEDFFVIGLDNLNSYYDVKIKEHRLETLKSFPNFTFIQADVSDHKGLTTQLETYDFEVVVNLAAQAGVRYSIENPFAYEESNLKGMTAILELCRNKKIKHLIYASSSSVYGANTKVPFSELDPVENPVSFYAATKRSNELMAIVYSRLFKLPATGLRFFTVYGPAGRPDMAYWSFTKKILAGLPVPVFGLGKLARDFTYIDDVVSAIVKLVDLPPNETIPHRILNVGNSKPETVNELLSCIEDKLNLKAIRLDQPMPLGDVERTFADCSQLMKLTGFNPNTKLSIGIGHFVDWYRKFYSM